MDRIYVVVHCSFENTNTWHKTFEEAKQKMEANISKYNDMDDSSINSQWRIIEIIEGQEFDAVF